MALSVHQAPGCSPKQPSLPISDDTMTLPNAESMPPQGPSRTLRIVIVWLVLATWVFLGFQAWLAQRDRTRFSASGGVVTLKRSPDGHYHWPGKVNGVPVMFMVDTGATRTALPPDVAERAGLKSVGKSRSSTAGGDVVVTDMLADVSLQGDGTGRSAALTAQRLRVGVLQQLDTPLLGMDVLSKLSITQQQGEMRITLPAP